MKAKEIAAKIIAARDTANDGLIVECLISVVNETIGLANSRKQDASRYSAIREGFQKWCSVTTQVEAAAPELSISKSHFLHGLFVADSIFFAQCVRANVFLGHTLSEEEQAMLARSREELANAKARERERRQAAEDARFEKAAGLPAGYVKQRRESQSEIDASFEMLVAMLMVRRELGIGRNAPAA